MLFRHPSKTVSLLSLHFTPFGLFFTEGLVILVRGRSTEYKPCGVQFLHACCDKLKGTYLMFNKKKMKFMGPPHQEDNVTAATATGVLKYHQIIETQNLTTQVISGQGNLCKLLKYSVTIILMTL